jgi:hypothetical protein
MHFARRLLTRAAALWRNDAAHWALTPGQASLFAAVPILIVVVMAASVPVFDLFVWITAEDSLLEWLQFLMVLLAAAFFARLCLRLFRTHSRLAAWLCLAMAAGLFFIAGEEIAWGQRLLGFGTPATLQAVNVQNETTLHNISSLHQAFVYGVMLGGLAAALAPLLWWALWRGHTRSPLTDLLVPPLCLVTAFGMPFGYRLLRLAFPIDARFPHLIFPITKFSEVTELCLYFGLVVFAWLNMRSIQPVLAGHAAPLPAAPEMNSSSSVH